jgi:hypothetical protein
MKQARDMHHGPFGILRTPVPERALARRAGTGDRHSRRCWAAVRDHTFRPECCSPPFLQHAASAARIRSGQRVSVAGKGAVNTR